MLEPIEPSLIAGTTWDLVIAVQQDGESPPWLSPSFSASVSSDSGETLIPETPQAGVGTSVTDENGVSRLDVAVEFPAASTAPVTYVGKAIVQLIVTVGGKTIGLVSGSIVICRRHQ